MDPLTLALLTAGISAGGSALGGLFGNKGGTTAPVWMSPPETKLGTKKRELIDDLLASVQGRGSYNDLFSTNEEGFQKSFVDPMKNLFNNQIAPQIQQNYIASGQQRGTGLEDTLARAGVNMDDILNQHYAQFQQQGQNNKLNALNAILGINEPQAQLVNAPQQAMSGSQAFGQGFGGYLSSPGFSNNIGNILRPKSKGFEDSSSTLSLRER